MQSINRAARRRSRREIAKHPQWGTLEEFARGRIQGSVANFDTLPRARKLTGNNLPVRRP